jgi:hypothetical protein
MKQTAVEWLVEQFNTTINYTLEEYEKKVEQAKEMEKKQLFLASKTSAKEAYKAGQQTMHCGCYEISDALTYEEWLYETFKSE